MLVKELKQAVRSRQFVGMFVLVQVVMILFVTFGLATATGTQGMMQLTAWFWTIIMVYLLGILPMTGLNALAREFDDARLDLLQLSSMNSRGIVLGKWLSLNIQGWLVVLSLAPYIALRYFVGSINPLYELGILALILYGSLIFSGVAICASVVKSKIVRGLMLIGGVIGMFFLLGGLASAFAMGGLAMASITSMPNFWLLIPLMLVASIPMGGLLLEFASARISPEAENHETPKRLYMLGLIAIWAIAFWADTEPELFLVPLFLGMIAVTISCMTNEPVNLPGVYQPFVRLGVLGRGLGRMLFYPGWPSGANFCVLLYLVSVGIVTLMNPSDLEEAVLFFTSALGCLLLPRAITLAAKLHDSGVRIFLLLQLVGVCLAILALLVEETHMLGKISDDLKDAKVTSLMFCVPQAGFLFSLERIGGKDPEYGLFLLGNALVAVLSYGLITFKSWKSRAARAALEAEAARILSLKRAMKDREAPAQAAPVEA